MNRFLYPTDVKSACLLHRGALFVQIVVSGGPTLHGSFSLYVQNVFSNFGCVRPSVPRS